MKTKTKFHAVYRGDGNVKTVLAPPKDWANVTPSEGRTGKKSRTRLAPLKERVWTSGQVVDVLMQKEAGLCQCRLLLKCAKPTRPLTQTDVLAILYAAMQDMKKNLRPWHSDSIDWFVKYNDDQLIFENLSGIIPTSGNDEAPTHQGHGAELDAAKKKQIK